MCAVTLRPVGAANEPLPMDFLTTQSPSTPHLSHIAAAACEQLQQPVHGAAVRLPRRHDGSQLGVGRGQGCAQKTEWVC